MSIKSGNFSIFAEVELDTSKIQEQLNKAGKGAKVTIDDSGVKSATKSLDELSTSSKKAKESADDISLSFNAANEIFSRTLDVVTAMVDQVYELDGALTEFRKVSTLSGESLANYVDQLSALGDEVGRTASEMVEAAAEFRKNSFNDEDSAQLAKLATMYQNVADEAISASDSASFMIAQMTAFDIDASGAEHIIDAVNEVRVRDLAKQGELLGA